METSASAPGLDSVDELVEVRWACDRLRERLGAERVTAWVLNETSGTITPVGSDTSQDDDTLARGRGWVRTPVRDFAVMRQVIEERQAISVPRAEDDARLPASLVAEFSISSVHYEPLMTDRPVGVLTVEPFDLPITDDARDLMRFLAMSLDQIASHRQAVHQRQQAELLLELTEAGAASGSLTETLGEICQRLALHARMDRACLYLLKDGVARPRMARYADGHEDREAWERFRSGRVDFKLSMEVVATGKPQIAEHAASPLIAGWWSDTFDVGSAIAVPVGQMPQLTGVLVLDDPSPRRFPPELVRLVAAAGAHVDGLISRAKADDQHKWRMRQLAAVRELLQSGAKMASTAEAGAMLARVATESFQADHGLFVLQRHGQIADLVAFGLDDEVVANLRSELIGERIDRFEAWQSSLGQDRPALFEEATTPMLPAVLMDGLGAQSFAVLPLASACEPLGIVHLGRTGRRTFQAHHRELAEQLCLEARLVADNVLLREKEKLRLDELAHHATHDPLTGLPNRSLFQDRLEQAFKQLRRDPHEVAMLFVDLDRFKHINDRIGHVLADELLQIVATRLRGCVREADTVARFAGDEFVVLLPSVDGVAAAERVARRIRTALSTPIEVGDTEIFVSASVGIACAAADVSDADRLMRSADAAMYRVKRSGRGRHAVYDPTIDHLDESALGLEADLHYALEREELSLRFQPIVELEAGKIHGFEALLRWEHPEHGMIPPLEFIPLAEANGTIFSIGSWVISQACEQLGVWRGEHPDLDLFVSVNLSPMQVHDPNLVSHVEQSLQRAGLPPATLLVEITESCLMYEEDGLPTLTELRELGVRIAIDDFGTGYSALHYLHRFPIDVLKVDRSFVSMLGGDRSEGALARTVMAIARTIGATAIAEGIERGDQLDELRELGSQLGQGYHFAAPLRSEEAEGWLVLDPGQLRPLAIGRDDARVIQSSST